MADYPKPITSVDDLPKNYDALPREQFWQEYWAARGTYKFDPYVEEGGTGVAARGNSIEGEAVPSSATGDDAGAPRKLKPRAEIFSIDTPPPTVSGNLHIGHVYSYTQTDMHARYQRMTGKTVFYPFGFDDNGLPTERLVEKEHGIRAHEVSREDFIRLCQQTARKYEAEFIALWKSLAISCDWDQFYTTIDERSRAISQASFIDLYNKGYIYRKVAPTQWDWVNQTAIAQAEIEDREVPGHFHYIKFQWATAPGAEVEGELVIGTTRPELIPACVAVMVNPESEDYVHDHEGNPVLDRHGNKVLQRDLIGKIAITPLFEVEVPILPSEKANPEKGTGILMCCTFGDQEDVEHWQIFNLPTRVIFDESGRIEENLHDVFGVQETKNRWLATVFETGSYSDLAKRSLEISGPSRVFPANIDDIQALAGLKITQARKWMVDKLLDRQLLFALVPINHTVRFAERGDVPVEILVTPQWYVNILEHKEALLEQGRKINWHPAYMRKRYEQWVEGLNSDWCISRQRYNGVPFPVWHDDQGKDLLPALTELPVNPLVDRPGNVSDGAPLYPDTDVMDTWATSSITPLLNTHFMPGGNFEGGTGVIARGHSSTQEGLEQSSQQPADFATGDDARATNSLETLQRHTQLFPYDMRPQAHDIIRTWAFYTIAKAYFHFGEIPWKDIVISGHAQDASRAKMSKSKGNTVTPAQMVEKYSADGLRYWSGSVKLGTDTVYDETKLGEGRKLINKLFNATKFALRHLVDYIPQDVGATRASPESRVGPSTTGDVRVAPTNAITYPTDLWLISRLNACIEKATAAQEAFEFGDAKQAIEDFFWADLCDNYLEFSKGRLYGEPLAVEAHLDRGSSDPHSEGGPGGPRSKELRRSAQATLYIAFSSVLRMLAPALPHITEECWSWYFAQWSDKSSIHLEEWPRVVGGTGALARVNSSEAKTVPSSAMGEGARAANTAADLLIHIVSAVRKWKSERGVSIKTPLSAVRIYLVTGGTPAPSFTADDLAGVLGDLLSTCNAQRAEIVDGPAPQDAVTTERSAIAVVCELAEAS